MKTSRSTLPTCLGNGGHVEELSPSSFGNGPASVLDVTRRCHPCSLYLHTASTNSTFTFSFSRTPLRPVSGMKIPLIGLGTAATNHNDLQEAVAIALQVGYRHFDTSKVYGSEHVLGEALNAAFQNDIVKREDVFVTTKLWNTDHDDPVSSIKTSLKDLQLEYVDLFLIHWPIKLIKEASLANLVVPNEEEFLPLDLKSTWEGMEKCVEMGLAKAIGVEMHPMWQQKKLRECCSKHNIHVSAWSPLGAPNTPWGTNMVIDSPVIKEIAHKHGKTIAQVCLRWGIEHGVSVLPKSYNKGRIIENFQIFDWSLSSDDHEKINKLEQKKILPGEGFVNATTSPYKTLEELWDDEI